MVECKSREYTLLFVLMQETKNICLKNDFSEFPYVGQMKCLDSLTENPRMELDLKINTLNYSFRALTYMLSSFSQGQLMLV